MFEGTTYNKYLFCDDLLDGISKEDVLGNFRKIPYPEGKVVEDGLRRTLYLSVKLNISQTQA